MPYMRFKKKTHIQLVWIANPDQLLVTPINPILSIHLVAPSPKATFEKNTTVPTRRQTLSKKSSKKFHSFVTQFKNFYV